MSELPISSPYRSTPDAPVGESDRDHLSARLNDAFSDGRIDAEEYQHRLDRLFAARRMGELVPVVDGLPPLQTYQSPAIVSAASTGRPGELATGRSGTGLALVTVSVLAGVLLLIAVILLIVL